MCKLRQIPLRLTEDELSYIQELRRETADKERKDYGYHDGDPQVERSRNDKRDLIKRLYYDSVQKAGTLFEQRDHHTTTAFRTADKFRINH